MIKILFMILICCSFLKAEFVKLDGVIYDKKSNLYWQYQIESKKTWQDGVDYCYDLVLGGYDDWRLPNKKELLSIVDYTKYNPALDDVFDLISSEDYWTSTTYADELSWAWIINFYSGVEHFNDKTGYQYVRCVRGETY